MEIGLSNERCFRGSITCYFERQHYFDVLNATKKGLISQVQFCDVPWVYFVK